LILLFYLLFYNHQNKNLKKKKKIDLMKMCWDNEEYIQIKMKIHPIKIISILYRLQQQ